MIGRLLYRLKQAWWRTRAALMPFDEAAVKAALSPGLLALFRRMPPGDRLHGLRVMQRLQAQGHTDPDLLVAALLHDAGKSRYRFNLLDRTLAVVTRRFAPGWYAHRGRGEARGLWRPLAVAVQHPAWSAEDMAAAGASELAVALVRRHQESLDGPPASREDRLLALLQSVDETS